MNLSKLRWATRTIISLVELFAIIFVIWLTYSDVPLNTNKTQIISVLIVAMKIEVVLRMITVIIL